MDKRVIFAVAGSGKTTHIIQSLSEQRRGLVITYTENNHQLLRSRVIQKFGRVPDNITILTYFTFLYSFCYKPFLHDAVRAKGINWNYPPQSTFRLNRNHPSFYQDSFSRLYSNRIAKLVEVKEGVVDLIIDRICKYYDQFFVDEVQDFGGNDFNLLKNLCRSDIDICFVGDFFQHTFDTSRDGNTNSRLYGDFDAYKQTLRSAGMIIDEDTLSHSYRCTEQVCDFVVENLGVNISSHKPDRSSVMFVSDEAEIADVFKCGSTVKLFYEDHLKYPCFSQNWGRSKGQDHYTDVCVVLNPTTMKAYEAGKLKDLVPSTRNKLYVACTRANNNLLFIEEARVKAHKKTV